MHFRMISESLSNLYSMLYQYVHWWFMNYQKGGDTELEKTWLTVCQMAVDASQWFCNMGAIPSTIPLTFHLLGHGNKKMAAARDFLSLSVARRKGHKEAVQKHQQYIGFHSPHPHKDRVLPRRLTVDFYFGLLASTCHTAILSC